MKDDIKIIRELAKKAAEISSLPEQEKKRKLWYAHNSLKGEKPLILIFPEGSWRELIPQSQLRCTDETARKIEMELLMRIYRYEHLKDDAPIEADFDVRKVVNGGQNPWLPEGDWGIDIEREYNEGHEMFAFGQSIKSIGDLEKLRTPVLEYDEKATTAALEKHEEYLGGILPVKLKGYSIVSFHMMKMYSGFRGLNQMYMDFYENPDMVHKFMEIMTEGYIDMVESALVQGLLEMNNDGSYHSSGGKSYTGELPQKDYSGGLRLKDMWASSEAQELAGVSPAMHKEFSLEYEKRILKLFGLNGYGCCEPLQLLIDDIMEIPNMRRISISPFADFKTAAEKLGGRAIFSFKPNPAHLVGGFDKDAVYKYIIDVIEVNEANGCKTEIILKDTHTCENHPERFDLWLEAARGAVANK